MAKAVELLERQSRILDSILDKLDQGVDLLATWMPRGGTGPGGQGQGNGQGGQTPQQQGHTAGTALGGIARQLFPRASRVAGVGIQSAGQLSRGLAQLLGRGGAGAAAAGAAGAGGAGAAAGAGGAAAGGAAAGGAGAIAAVANPVGLVVAGLVTMTVAVGRAVEALQEFGNNMHSTNMQFAQFSAAMRGVQARQMMRDIQLSRERGDRRAAMAEQVAESQHRMNEATARMRDSWDNLTSSMFVGISKAFQPMLDAFSKVTEKVLDAISGRDQSEEARKLALHYEKEQKNFYAIYGRPGRFQQPGIFE